jgi:hypothetical protein
MNSFIMQWIKLELKKQCASTITVIEDSLYRFQRKKGMDLLAQILNQGRDWPHLGNRTLVQLAFTLYFKLKYVY